MKTKTQALTMSTCFAILLVGGGCSDVSDESFETASDELKAAPVSLKRQTAEGVLEGKLDGATVAFFGVPFAAPPVGGLRWRAPAAPLSYTGVRKATTFAPKCIQAADTSEGSEDCLYLNVWTPKGAVATSNLPVMVFVHGGAYFGGSASDTLPSTKDKDGALFYNGRSLAESRQVVVVSIQYRLGALGFLSHPTLAQRQGESSGNYGTKDMIAALRWVRSNVGAFGGAPSRVTVFGESAGGWGVCSLLLAPQAAGLFQSAIMESGPCVEQSEARAKPVAEAVFAKLGCKDAACASTKSAVQVADAFNVVRKSYTDAGKDMVALNTYGTDVRPLPVFTAIELGKYNKVPIVIGTNKSELLVPSKTDENMTCGVYWLSQAFAKAQTQPVYRYQFTHKPLNVIPALHGTELPYVFGMVGDIVNFPRAEDLATVNVMQSYWSQLAKANSVIGATGMPPWTADRTTAPTYMELDSTPVQRTGSAITRPDVCTKDAVSVPDDG